MLDKLKLNYDQTDLLFRLLFSSIFLGLGGEHLFSDALIQGMMPEWMPLKRVASIGAGVILLGGGLSILTGYKTRQGAMVLAGFLLTVTIVIHFPALFSKPSDLPETWHWLWDVYQRSNFVKNFCLLGVCLHLTNHEVGRYSLENYFTSKTT